MELCRFSLKDKRQICKTNQAKRTKVKDNDFHAWISPGKEDKSERQWLSCVNKSSSFHYQTCAVREPVLFPGQVISKLPKKITCRLSIMVCLCISSLKYGTRTGLAIVSLIGELGSTIRRSITAPSKHDCRLCKDDIKPLSNRFTNQFGNSSYCVSHIAPTQSRYL